jgi:transcriptional regulator with XRE-family HTH domain
VEFNEKLQQLRRDRGLTQEEVAEALFVSRTAISKWESGRGYPSIDSLKEISKFFSVTIDELLSGSEALTIAEEDTNKKAEGFRDLVFGLLDFGMVLFFFLPIFRQSTSSANLFSLSTPYLRTVYVVAVAASVFLGILTLALQNCQKAFWLKSKYKVSLTLGALVTALFIVGLQPYAAIVSFLFVVIRVFVLIKR